MKYNFNKAITCTNQLTKRIFDFSCSLTGLFILMPLFVIIGIMIKLDSPGPIFFRGSRMGQYKKPFGILKFRTMYERIESYSGPKITAKNDDRITPLGQKLRDSKINELPQLFNVLFGEMSLVGPRPEDPDIVRTWTQDVQNEILSVKPGITSPASVLYRNEETLLDTEDLMSNYLNFILPSKIRLDQLYVRNNSFILDLDIIFWTFLVLLTRTRTDSPNEDRLFGGPFSWLSKWYFSWLFVDITITLVAMFMAGAIWGFEYVLRWGYNYAIICTLVFPILMSLSGGLLGLNRVIWSRAMATDAIDLGIAVSIMVIFGLLANRYLAGFQVLPMRLIGTAAILAYIGFVLVRFRDRIPSSLLRRWLSFSGFYGAVQERVLIIGGGEAGRLATWILTNSKQRNLFFIVGYIDDDRYVQGGRIGGVNIIGKREDIQRIVLEQDIGVILFAIHNINEKDRQVYLQTCRNLNVKLFVLPDIFGAVKDFTIAKASPDDSSLNINLTGLGIDPEIALNWIENLEGMIELGYSAKALDFLNRIRCELKKLSYK